jgi:hypothetical protein
MKDDFTLPEEFEHAKIQEINICQGIPQISCQPGDHFRNYSREMQEAQRAHLIECNVKAIPFLRMLISYIKELKLAVRLIWGGHAHNTKTLNWDSPKGDISQFVEMMQDHTCFNMSVTSIKVCVILDLAATDKVLCPSSGNIREHLSL